MVSHEDFGVGCGRMDLLDHGRGRGERDFQLLSGVPNTSISEELKLGQGSGVGNEPGELLSWSESGRLIECENAHLFELSPNFNR